LRLSELIEDVPLVPASRPPDPNVTGLTCDSRAVEPGYLFAAFAGSRADGADFIDDAIARGAVAVLVAPDMNRREPIAAAVIADPNPRRRYAQLAARFYADQPRTIAAVTGTNGKSSVVSFLRQIWTRLGRPSASLGTLGMESDRIQSPVRLTTPDAALLHLRLAELAHAGIDHLAIEASSHGLDQHRIDGVRIGAAAFTNLTRDHLDYHGSIASYLAAKRRLFESVMAPGGVAVLNAESPEFEGLAQACWAKRHRVIAYGRHAPRSHRAVTLADLVPTPRGQRLTIEADAARWTGEVPLIGSFQADNLLCAAALAIGCGDDAEAVLEALPGLTGVPGRVERVATLANGASIFVDYAHTPDALRALLTALRDHVTARLCVIFGCGGERDPGKRVQMGQAAAALADRVIVTDDNPRGEDPAAIRAAVLAGCADAEEIGDRAQAIVAAIRELEPGDLLVIAGKGHETGQIVAGTTIPFDDAEVARQAVRSLAGAGFR
jgi:UDP-N-acetylmuramoyl-L-alanyl-D-glutamate--2,6-diaminopimelate ligase